MPGMFRAGAGLALGVLACLPTAPPARADCLEQVGEARAVANAMTNELSRRFALAHLHDALSEYYGGDEEECRDELAEAERIIRTQPYTLAPGERLGLAESETPPPQPAGSAARPR